MDSIGHCRGSSLFGAGQERTARASCRRGPGWTQWVSTGLPPRFAQGRGAHCSGGQ